MAKRQAGFNCDAVKLNWIECSYFCDLKEATSGRKCASSGCNVAAKFANFDAEFVERYQFIYCESRIQKRESLLESSDK